MQRHGKDGSIYGGRGFIGGGVAQTFAREGARVFLVGRTESSLRAAADAGSAAGSSARFAIVDALDEPAVDRRVRSVVEEAGRLDVSFNLISRGDVHGTRLLEIDVDDFVAPTLTLFARTSSLRVRPRATWCSTAAERF
jgi:NAD(P)-dependent dehydrogenase (short-subunit alcohol dehydrogenase family)